MGFRSCSVSAKRKLRSTENCKRYAPESTDSAKAFRRLVIPYRDMLEAEEEGIAKCVYGTDSYTSGAHIVEDADTCEVIMRNHV